jgi:hypothetical protein
MPPDLIPGIPDSSDFLIEQQLMSNWCWASITAALCSFYNDDPAQSQQQLASLITGNPVCGLGTFDICNVTCDLEVVLGRVTHLDATFENPLPADQLVEALNGGANPVACQMDLPGIGGHAVVIINTYTTAEEGLMIQAADPRDGSIQAMTYDQFTNNYRNLSGSWVRSYTTR